MSVWTISTCSERDLTRSRRLVSVVGENSDCLVGVRAVVLSEPGPVENLVTQELALRPSEKAGCGSA